MPFTTATPCPRSPRAPQPYSPLPIPLPLEEGDLLFCHGTISVTCFEDFRPRGLIASLSRCIAASLCRGVTALLYKGIIKLFYRGHHDCLYISITAVHNRGIRALLSPPTLFSFPPSVAGRTCPPGLSVDLFVSTTISLLLTLTKG